MALAHGRTGYVPARDGSPSNFILTLKQFKEKGKLKLWDE